MQHQTAQPSDSGPSAHTTITTSLPNNGAQNVHSRTARRHATVALVSALVPLLFLGIIIVVLFVRWRRRRRAAAATERVQRFVGIPLESHAQLRRGETNEALRVGKTPFLRITHPWQKGAPHETPLRARERHTPRAIFVRAEQALGTAGSDPSARQAQLRLAEENLALRMRIREMECLTISNVNSSGGRASTVESVAPPDYEDAGIVLL